MTPARHRSQVMSLVRQIVACQQRKACESPALCSRRAQMSQAAGCRQDRHYQQNYIGQNIPGFGIIVHNRVADDSQLFCPPQFGSEIKIKS